MGNKSTIGFEMTNFAENAALLRELPASVESRVMGDAVGQALKPMQADARARAPKDTGALKRSIAVKVKRYPNAGIVVGLVGPSKDYFKNGRRLKVGQNRRGADKPANYAHLIEYGHFRVAGRGATGKSLKGKTIRKSTANAKGWVPARPFMRPAAVAQRDNVLNGLEAGVVKGLERETKRLASKMKRVTKGN